MGDIHQMRKCKTQTRSSAGDEWARSGSLARATFTLPANALGQRHEGAGYATFLRQLRPHAASAFRVFGERKAG